MLQARIKNWFKIFFSPGLVATIALRYDGNSCSWRRNRMKQLQLQTLLVTIFWLCTSAHEPMQASGYEGFNNESGTSRGLQGHQNYSSQYFNFKYTAPQGWKIEEDHIYSDEMGVGILMLNPRYPDLRHMFVAGYRYDTEKEAEYLGYFLNFRKMHLLWRSHSSSATSIYAMQDTLLDGTRYVSCISFSPDSNLVNVVITASNHRNLIQFQLSDKL